MNDLHGKHALIFGVASEESIAWGVAKELHRAGARISLGYQQRFKSRILQLVNSGEVPVEHYDRCDVTDPEELDAFFAGLPPQPIDILVHSVAWAPPEALAKPIREVQRDEFAKALVTSAWSLLPVTERALPRMEAGGSVITMSYLGGQRVVVNYRLMGIAKAALEHTVRELAVDVGPRGIRVNAISAGPVRTLAASQIPGIDSLLRAYEKFTPLRRNVDPTDVGHLAAFLASDKAKNITGQVMFVDAGASIMALAELCRENSPVVF